LVLVEVPTTVRKADVPEGYGGFLKWAMAEMYQSRSYCKARSKKCMEKQA
jgi:hypothetical protein